jgi:hypothetical protein
VLQFIMGSQIDMILTECVCVLQFIMGCQIDMILTECVCVTVYNGLSDRHDFD